MKMAEMTEATEVTGVAQSPQDGMTEQSMMPQYPTGRLVIKFLQEKEDGATIAEILRHLRTEHKTDSRDLSQMVESLLENGTAMGFLEKKGSHFVNWLAREERCRRRRKRSRCRRRRRRCIRRRRSCIRRRRSCRHRRRRCR